MPRQNHHFVLTTSTFSNVSPPLSFDSLQVEHQPYDYPSANVYYILAQTSGDASRALDSLQSGRGGPLGRYRSTHPGLKRLGDECPDQFEELRILVDSGVSVLG